MSCLLLMDFRDRLWETSSLPASGPDSRAATRFSVILRERKPFLPIARDQGDEMESQITTYNPVNTQINNAVRCWQWEDVWEKWEGFRLEEFGRPVCTTTPSPYQASPEGTSFKCLYQGRQGCFLRQGQLPRPHGWAPVYWPRLKTRGLGGDLEGGPKVMILKLLPLFISKHWSLENEIGRIWFWEEYTCVPSPKECPGN